MRFQVPQFIEVEDKILGPLTLKQGIYLAGGGGIIVVLFTLLPRPIAFLLGIPVAAFSAALAFYKINNKSFIYIIEAFVRYFTGEKLYIWKKEEKKVVKGDSSAESANQVFIPRLSDSKLKDLSWSLDVTKSTGTQTKEEKIVGEEIR
jgi:hypothetical protein